MDPFDEALNWIEKKDYPAGRSILEKLVEGSDDANSQNVLFNIAVCHAQEGQYQEALKIMDNLKFQDDYDLRFNKAMCEFQSSNCENVHDYYKRMMELLDAIITSNRDGSQGVKNRIVAELVALLWNFSLYQNLETVLLKAKQLVPPDCKAWTQSLAHTLFMMDNRYEECCELYSQLLPNEADQPRDLLSADPYVLANLCVSLVLTGLNGEAEQLIKEVENGENRRTEIDIEEDDQNTQISHLDIINLAIGTLYCVKNNQEFGLIRIFKTFKAFDDKRQQRDNYAMKWFYAKRCILSLLDAHCKQMIFVKDEVFDLIITFLKQCERYGLTISTLHHGNHELDQTKNLSIEARYLRSIMVRMFHDS